MPRVAGTYSPPAGTTATPNTTIESAKYNASILDVATALTESINKDGTKAFAADQPMGGFKFTNLATGSARTDSISLGQAQDGKANWAVAGGTADAITLTLSPAITALVDGQEVNFRATAANATTTPTLAVNGLTARTITKVGGSALTVNDIVGALHECTARYNLANTRWELQNPAYGNLIPASTSTTQTGTNSVRYVTPDGLAALWEQGSNNTGGAVITIGEGGHHKLITSVVAITSFVVTTDKAGRTFDVEFDTVRTLTDNASIDVPGGSITTAQGDVARIKSNGDGTVKVLSYDRAAGQLTLATAQASTSGTSIDFTSVPAGTKRITVMLAGVSTSGTSSLLIQLGDSGGIETTGYLGGSSVISSGTSATNSTTGFLVEFGGNDAAAAIRHGAITLTNITGSTWAASGVVALSNSGVMSVVAGSKPLSATLDRVRVTTVGGADTFDAGSINIMYE